MLGSHYFCRYHDPCDRSLSVCEECRNRVDAYFEVERFNLDRYEGRVYYLVDGDTIKIGYSRNVCRRVREMQRSETDVLVTEPGGRARETERHRQFTKSRIGNSEWFHVSDDLLEHVGQLWAIPSNRYTPRRP